MTRSSTAGLSVEVLEARLNLSTVSSSFTAAAAALDNTVGVLSPTRRYRLVSLPDATQALADAAKAAPGGNPAQVFFDAVKAQPTAPAATSTTLPAAIATTSTVTPPRGARVLQGSLQAIDWSAPASNLSTQSGMMNVNVVGITDAQIAAFAAQSRTKPAGGAALMISGLDALMTDPLCRCKTSSGALTSYWSPWLDPGIADVKALTTNFFSKFYADGGRADYVIDDFERNLSYWGISTANIQAIQADPRSTSITQALGPTIFRDVLANKPTAFYAWNSYMITILSNGLNAAEFNVAAKYFPNARTSNYNYFDLSQQNVVPDLNGWMQYNASYAGNRQAPQLYGGMGNIANAILPGTTTRYGNSPFADVRLVTNTLRGAALSSTVPIDPWIAGPGFTSSPLSNTAYYQEALYQEALSGAESFLYWNPTPIATAAQNAMVDQTLATLNQKLGTGPRWSVTPAEMAWNSPLVVSGMQTATSVLWRITAPPGTRKIKVVETGEILNLNGAAGVWYTSQPSQPIDFVILS